MKVLKKPIWVGWYNPLQHACTASKALISTIFRKNADQYLMQALSNATEINEKQSHDFSDEEASLRENKHKQLCLFSGKRYSSVKL